MSTHLSVFALFAILIASIGVSPIFGQTTEDPISVETDKDSYNDGDIIMVSGKVKDRISGTPISLQVISANGNLITIEQVEVNDDKEFQVSVSAGGPLWKNDGTYTIKVLYGSASRTAETSFNFGVVADITPPTFTGNEIDIDGFGIGYKITGGSLNNITPDEEGKSLILEIDAIDDGELTIDFPREVIDSRSDDCSGEDRSFFVIIDGEEVDFTENTSTDTRSLTIGFFAGSEQIEIIGTCVIPEFGTVAVMILAVAIISIIALTARSKLGITLKY